MVPVVPTGTREANSTRTDSRAAPATLRLHLDVSILRQAQDCYVAKNAFAFTTEAKRCLVSLEEPGAQIKREHLATPLGMSPDRSPQGRPSLTYATVKDGDDTPTVLGTALVALAPRLATPAQSQGLTHARYFLPIRLDGAHEAIRAYFVLYGS
jgi:hypothetical protein